jgi:hypothetical protein
MLRRTVLAGFAGIAAAAALSIMPAAADQWILIGQQKVGKLADKDVYLVGADKGQFSALKFRVTGNRVAVAEVRVFYGNGTSEFLPVKEHIKNGDETKAYDLKGNYRLIERIEVLYQSENPFKGQATFQIFGFRHTVAPPPSDWVTLGTTRANLLLDHDTIQVGANKGAFRKLRFHVQHRPIHLFDIRVTFGNGQVQVYNFNKHLPAGVWSAPLDLIGDKRFIRQIDIIYKKDPSFPGDAFLTIQGER